jgi:glucose 1-dehydrogenase
MLLEDKVAVVTGGNSGIGKAIVLALGEAGASVCVDYVVHQDITPEERARVDTMRDRLIAVKADVSQVAELRTLVDETVKVFGRLDILVNNAGIETRTSVLDTTEAQYDRVMDINLKGAFFGTQLAAKQMIAQGDGGRIINISSIHEDWPMPGNTPYCLSKGGMRMLTRNAGVELAPHGITVVGVGPGAVATPINVETMQDPELMAALNAAIPLGRMAAPKEIADLVVWLASDQASYVTATTFIVDGGMMQFSPGL